MVRLLGHRNIKHVVSSMDPRFTVCGEEVKEGNRRPVLEDSVMCKKCRRVVVREPNRGRSGYLA